MIDSAEKLYSVSQLGLDLGVSARTIRFYETKGLIAPRRAGNNRVYTQRDRGRMILILRGKKLGFTLREIREYLDLYDADPTRSRILKLEDQRVALDEALGELREVESQANAALSSLESASRRAAPPMKPVSKSPTSTRPTALENQD